MRATGKRRRFYTVYRLTNLVNGKIYIGRHATYSLKNDYLGAGTKVKRAVARFGRKKFKKEILFVFDTGRQSHDKERELVTEQFCQRVDTYNMIPGGQGSFNHINRILPHSFRVQIGKKGGPLAAAETMRKRTGLFGMSREQLLAACVAGGHAHKGKPKSAVMKAKAREYIWITDGSKSRKLKHWLPLPVGFRRGRTLGAFYGRQ